MLYIFLSFPENAFENFIALNYSSDCWMFLILKFFLLFHYHWLKQFFSSDIAELDVSISFWVRCQY